LKNYRGSEMFELKIKTHFAAAHRLTMVGEKCENLHGHNWKIEARITGEKLNEGGVLIDFGEIKRYIAEIMDQLDHKYLNEIDAFANQPPSSENIALYIAKELQKRIVDPSIKVSRISAWESDNSCATYIV
jgi:6-pyruvoyltetrahydropterin/6-carboxytetrahydropterin synthase